MAGLTDCQQALGFFQSAGDVDNEASTYSTIAEHLSFLGDTVQAWTAWHSALQRVELAQERRSRYVVLQAASYAALRNEHEHGMKTLSSPDFLAGVERFGAGEGRHGAPA